MNQTPRFLRLALIFVLGISAGFSETGKPLQSLKLNQDGALSISVPASGKHDVLLPISKWGRYSVRCTGDQPVSLSIADRRVGVITRDGEIGQRNPRIDLFLDIGEYRLSIQGAKKAAGTSMVTATPFSLSADFKPAVLIPKRENRVSLNDFEQAPFWFEAVTDTLVYIEAVGRHLTDLVLWRDGEWLVPTKNRNFLAKPKDETPLSGIAFSVRIPKGMYMVAAYGGKGRSWATKSEAHPLYLQMGMESLANNSMLSLTIPPRGYAQYLLGPEISTVVIEGVDKQRLMVEVHRLGLDFSMQGRLATDSIFQKSNSPRMAMRVGALATASGQRMVKISGTPGQVFSLLGLGSNQGIPSTKLGGSWWISSLHTGDFQDQLGASGFVVDAVTGAIKAQQVDTLAANRDLAKKFNLLANLNTYLWVDENAKYTVMPGGVSYSWRVRRYFLTPPPNYAAPEFSAETKTLELNQGLYLLEMAPNQKGIATIVLKKASLLGGVVAAGKAAMGVADNRQWTRPRPAIRFANIPVNANSHHVLVLNSQDPEISVIAARALPINPDEALSFWCGPGENLEIPIQLTGRRVLEITDTKGARATFNLDGKPVAKAVEVEAGNHGVTLVGGGTEWRFYMLRSIPLELVPSGPMPLFPDEKRKALPKFPSIIAGTPVYLDLDRNSTAPYAVIVREPGLYRIETTGRLATALSLSDRFLHFNRTADKNGIGRNAFLMEYLLPGEYQLTATTVGQSAGHFGLAVTANALASAGALEANIDNRKFVEAFSGAEYSVKISTSAKYRIESIGQNGNFPLRLEDQEGWPIEPALSTEALVTSLPTGSYRLISLPTAQEGRRITRLIPMVEKRSIKGKGPHSLTLNTTLASTWMEKKSPDTVRTPALFTLRVSAPIQANLNVTKGFKAQLYRSGKDSLLVAWSGQKKFSMGMGDFQIKVLPEKKQNYAPYQVSVTTRDLIPGLSFDLNKAQTLAVSLGTSSIVELGSQGLLDVTATLLAEDGKTVLAVNDDGFMDWNFSISRALKPGRYFLRTESAQPGFSSTTVFMRALTDSLMDSLMAPAGKAITQQRQLNRRLGVFPLASLNAGDMIVCAVVGKSHFGISLEKQGKDSADWTLIAQTGGANPSLSIPRSMDARYRIKIWSESNSDESFALSYASPTAQVVDWKTAASGLAGQGEAVGTTFRAWYKVDLGSHAPGHFQAHADQNQLSTLGLTIALNQVLSEEDAAGFASNEKYAWMEFRFEEAGRFKVKLEPLGLKKTEPLTVTLPGREVRVFQTPEAKNSLALVTVETDGGNPLLGMLAHANARLPAFKLRGLATGIQSAFWSAPNRSATVSLPSDERRLALWNSLPSSDGTTPTAKLIWTDLPLGEGGALLPGISRWQAMTASAQVFHLAKGALFRLRITIPVQGAVLVERGDGSSVLECAFEEPLVREFLTEGGNLYLLGLKEKSNFDMAAFSLSTQDRSQALAEQNLSPETGWQTKWAREGASLLPISGRQEKALGLYFRGGIKNAEWIGADGIVRANLYSGEPVGPGGFLRLVHEAGWARMNLCDATSAASVMGCKWGATLSPSNATTLDQTSLAQLHQGINWFTFVLKDAQHVNFSVPLPVSALLLKDGIAVNYQEGWEGFNWDLPLQPGKYHLGLNSLAGSSLEASSLSTLFRSINTFSEKQPFKTYLTPGESRLVAFEVAKENHYGIGLQMNKETVQARLFDAQGKQVDQGKQQFVSLKPGKYYLWLRIPEGSEGTDLTANLFGQEPPPNEPPEKLVRWIINGEGGPRPDMRDNESVEPENQRPEWERLIQRDGEGQGEGGEYSTGESLEGEGSEENAAVTEGQEEANADSQEGNSEEAVSEEEGSEGE